MTVKMLKQQVRDEERRIKKLKLGEDGYATGRLLDMKNDLAALLKELSPGNPFRLPKLLNKKRLEYGITDGAFEFQPAFDRVYVFQVSQVDISKTDGGIIRPDQAKRRELESAPQGILVAAGLVALDQLKSHGIELGHLVTLLRYAPYRIRYDILNGKDKYLTIMQAGDIVGSKELGDEIAAGRTRVEYDEATGRHCYVKGKKKIHPMEVELPPDY